MRSWLRLLRGCSEKHQYGFNLAPHTEKILCPIKKKSDLSHSECQRMPQDPLALLHSTALQLT